MADNIRRVYEIDVKYANEAVAALRAMQQDLKSVEKSGRDAKDALRDIDKVLGGGDLARSIKSFGLLKQGIDAVVDTIATIPRAFVDVTKSILETQSSLERLRLGFASLSGATGENTLRAAARDIDYLRKTTNDLGIDFTSSAQSFLKMTAAAKGTTLEGDRTREIFEAISLASRNLGLTIPQTENAFRAIQQIMSKGVVQQEELRGQLSEALPNAIQVTARALGMTTAELNKFVATGKFTADVFVTQFARQLKQEMGVELPAGVNESTQALVKFSSQFEQLKQAATDSGLATFFAGQLNILSDAFQNVTTKIRIAKEEGGGFLKQMAAGASGIVAFLNPVNAFKYSPESEQNQARERQQRLAELNAKSKKPNSGFSLGDFDEQTRLIQKETEYQQKLNEVRNNAGVGEQRQIANILAERTERDRLSRVLGDLQKKYTDHDLVMQREIADLDKLRAAGDITTKEYERLHAAIVKKNTILSDAQKLEEKQFERAQKTTESVREQIAVQQDLGKEYSEHQKVLKLQASIQEDLAKSTSKRVTAELQHAAALTKVLESETRSAEQRKAVIETNKKLAEATTSRVHKLTEEAEAEERAIATFGKHEDAIRQLAIAELELTTAEADRNYQESIRDSDDAATIQRLKDLSEGYNRLLRAKKELEFKSLMDEGSKRQSDAFAEEYELVQKRQQDIKDALISNFKRSKDIGRALFDTIQDAFEDKIVKVVVDAVTDPLVRSLDKVLQAFDDELVQLLGEFERSQGSNSLIGAIAKFLGFGGGSKAGGSGGTGITDWSFTSGDFGMSGGAFAGGFARGGYIGPGMWGLVGENGPEPAYGGKTGLTVQPNSGPGVTINIIDAPQGTTVQERETPNGRVIDVLIRQAKSAVASDIRQGGEVSSSIQDTFGANRLTPRTGF